MKPRRSERAQEPAQQSCALDRHKEPSGARGRGPPEQRQDRWSTDCTLSPNLSRVRSEPIGARPDQSTRMQADRSEILRNWQNRLVPTPRGRIVHCADYGGPYSGSFVPMLVAAASAARDRGYETTICFAAVARDRPWLGDLGDLAEIRFVEPSGIREDLRQLERILDEIDGRPTVLHTHFGTFDVPAALLGMRRRRTAVLWHAHSGTVRRIRLRSKVYGVVFGHIVNGVICVSPAMYDDALARQFPATRLRLLPNAIDLDRFQPIAPEEHAAARRALGLPSSAKVVLHFAWNWAIKGGELLLETAELLGAADAIGASPASPEVVFLTVVGEDGGDAPRDKLARLPNIRALAPRGNVNELYAAADVFLNCSRAEGGIPYAVLEALARGLPAVVTDPPVLPEVVDGLPGGRAVPPQPDAIISALREVLAFTPAQRADHATEARARIASSYSLQPWSQQLVDLYDEALGLELSRRPQS